MIYSFFLIAYKLDITEFGKQRTIEILALICSNAVTLL